MAISSCYRGLTCGADRYRSGRYALASDRGVVSDRRLENLFYFIFIYFFICFVDKIVFIKAYQGKC